MFVLAILLAYLVIGTLIGRRLFVNRLGDNPRTYKICHDPGCGTYATKDMVAAVNWAITSVVAWPLAFPVYAIQAETPFEKNTRREKEYKELERKIKELSQELDPEEEWREAHSYYEKVLNSWKEI